MTLASVTLITGLLLLAAAVAALARPEAFQRFLQAFPRSVLWGRVLVVVELPVAAWLAVQDPPIAGNALFTRMVWGATPVVIILVMRYLDELLAARAFGALLLLAAHPILFHARLHDSDARLIMPVFAYALVVLGLIILLSPYRFRHLANRMAASPSTLRACGLAGAVLGGLFAALGLFVY